MNRKIFEDEMRQVSRNLPNRTFPVSTEKEIDWNNAVKGITIRKDMNLISAEKAAIYREENIEAGKIYRERCYNLMLEETLNKINKKIKSSETKDIYCPGIDVSVLDEITNMLKSNGYVNIQKGGGGKIGNENWHYDLTFSIP